jgi:CTP:molybdopterin cytidylyltransferase MocA
VLAALRRSSVDEVVVVAGAHSLEVSGVRVVVCEEWARGPGASLRCGLRVLPADVRRAVVVLADGPDLDPRAVDRLLRHPAPVAAASYDGTRDHPVALARDRFDSIPDEGGRVLDAVLVDCSDLRPPDDLDVRDSREAKRSLEG